MFVDIFTDDILIIIFSHTENIDLKNISLICSGTCKILNGCILRKYINKTLLSVCWCCKHFSIQKLPYICMIWVKNDDTLINHICSDKCRHLVLQQPIISFGIGFFNNK